MNLIAIESSTETLSLGVHAGAQRRVISMPGAANASAQLLPSLKQLLSEAGLGFAQLDAVVWGRGPGSFTGLRTACAVAQGIGFAHDLPLLGVDSLAACAYEASQSNVHDGSWLVALDARMSEVYVARYAQGVWAGASQHEFELLSPEAIEVMEGDLLCGNAAAVYPVLAGKVETHVQVTPNAQSLLELAPSLLAQGLAVAAQEALPRYVRNKVALTTAERGQIKRKT